MIRKFRFTKACMEQVAEFYRNLTLPPAAKPKKEPPAPPVTRLTDEEAYTREELSRVLTASRTDVGKVRAINQDALLEGTDYYGVADGMGGHQGGEVASALARDSLGALLAGKTPDGTVLREAVVELNQIIHRKAEETETLEGMGTTITVLWMGEKEAILAHVGDSRAYLYRKGHLIQMTEDHSLVADLVREGLITPSQAATHPLRNVVTRSVGTEENLQVDVMHHDRQQGDVWLICSDGLHGLVSFEELREAMEIKPLEKAADELLRRALQAGGRDNISLLLLRDGRGPLD